MGTLQASKIDQDYGHLDLHYDPNDAESRRLRTIAWRTPEQPAKLRSVPSLGRRAIELCQRTWHNRKPVTGTRPTDKRFLEGGDLRGKLIEAIHQPSRPRDVQADAKSEIETPVESWMYARGTRQPRPETVQPAKRQEGLFSKGRELLRSKRVRTGMAVGALALTGGALLFANHASGPAESVAPQPSVSMPLETAPVVDQAAPATLEHSAPLAQLPETIAAAESNVNLLSGETAWDKITETVRSHGLTTQADVINASADILAEQRVTYPSIDFDNLRPGEQQFQISQQTVIETIAHY